MNSDHPTNAIGHPFFKVQFVYDWQGRRIARHLWHGGTLEYPTFKSSHRWLYDGWNVIAEFSAPEPNSTTLTRTKTYTWGLDLSGTLQGAGGVGGLLSVQSHDPQSAIHYPSYDGNGNIIAWTQNDASAPAARREYDAFGNTLVAEGTAPCDFGFSTKMREEMTGLYYYGYRFYDPLMGRWLSRDPIAERGGINLYGFVGNDGANNWDYLGLTWFDDIWNTVGDYFEGNQGIIPGQGTQEWIDQNWNEFWFDLVVSVGELPPGIPQEFLKRYISGIGGNRNLSREEFLDKVIPRGSLTSDDAFLKDLKDNCHFGDGLKSFKGVYAIRAFDTGHFTGGLGNFIVDADVKVCCEGPSSWSARGTAKLRSENWDFDFEWKKLGEELAAKIEAGELNLRGRQLRTALGSAIPGKTFRVSADKVRIVQTSDFATASFY